MRRALMALFIGLTTAITVSAGAGSTVAALPPGFIDSTVVSVSSPTAVEALPDGRVIVLEQGGKVKRIDDRSGPAQVRTMLDLDVCTSANERGLLGFTIDPDYAFSGYVYIFYTVVSGQPGGCHNRVSRFTMDEAAIYRESERVLVDNISSINGNHNAGDLDIGNDGYLYISTGDAGRDPRGDSGSGGGNDAAADLSLLNGKILRVDRATGAAAPGNPFSGSGTADCRLRGNTPTTPSTTCREIFAYGLRNPYRFAFDPNTSATRFFINDVGQNRREEVNLGAIGADYGWNAREGQCPQGQNPPCAGPPSGVTDPITDYDHSLGTYITAGTFIPDGVWPAEYDGGYLFGDGGTGRVWLRTASGAVDYSDTFMSGKSGLTDMAFAVGPEGHAMYYTEVGGTLSKVEFPTAAAPADSGPQRYEPLPTMERRFDSRTQTPPAPLRAGQTRLLDIDAPAGATAALVNITLVRPAVSGAFATSWQPRTSRPPTSNVNAPGGAVVGNSSIVPLDDEGRLLLFVQATSGVVVDVAGFFFDAPAALAAGRFEALAPDRLIDTRDPVSSENDFERAADGAGERITVPIAGAGGLPGSGDDIAAVVMVAAGINNEGSNGGFATAHPSGTTRPLASSVNVNGDSDVRANLVVVPVSSAGTVEVYLEGVDNLTLDVAGWFTSATAPSAAGGRFHLTAPAREADTRTGLGFGPLAGGATASLNPVSVPNSASAIAQNLTLAPSGGRGYVSAYPGTDRPIVSNINASAAGQVRGALGFTALESGAETFYSEGPNQLVVDSFGWFE